MRVFTSLFLALLFSAGAVPAREVLSICGSHPDLWREEIALHQEAARRRAAQRQRIGLSSAAGEPGRKTTRDIGDIVLMDDSGGVISRRNDFDLDNRTLRFQPSDPAAGAYRFTMNDGGYDANDAASGRLIFGFGDDESRHFDLPFPFSFYGRRYTDIFVNSDGNLSFGAADSDSTVRSLGRLTSGPPQIAPLFRDLDPTKALDGVHVLAAADRFVVSWVAVPDYSAFGRGPLETFQVRLFPDGRIEFAYHGIQTLSAVVGIAPGALHGATAVVSFSSAESGQYTAAVVERFTNIREVDVVMAAQRFYEDHDDAYDYLVFYDAVGVAAAPGAVAFEIPIRNHRSGYGDPPIDVGEMFGSAHRLQALMNMGQLSQYPDDPTAVLPVRALAGDTPLTILGHEAGHLFLAYASIRDPHNPDARPMLGRGLAHWNFSFNSDASLLEGNRICDRQRTPDKCPKTPVAGRFVTTGAVEHYSALDQYLMGLRPPREVPDTFLVENSSILDPGRMPQVGVAFNGTRRDIRIGEIIDAEGHRTPDSTVSQRHFRFAFVLIVAAGSEPPAATIEKLDRYRSRFETFFRTAAGDRAWADTEIRRGLRLSTFPATGILLGRSIPATVSIEHPAETDLTVLFTSVNGAVGVPDSVTIPAGATSASVRLSGLRAGVDEISATIPGGAYQTAYSKFQVAASGSQLRLVAVSGDKQVVIPGSPLPDSVVVRVTDINNLPYPGLRVAAASSPGGTTMPAAVVTDSSGQASFDWEPVSISQKNQLHVALDGVAEAPALNVTTAQRPLVAFGGVVNAASFQPTLSPGALASIFGVNLAAGVTASAQLPVPTELQGVRVLINNQPAPLLYASDAQINFVVPANLTSGQINLIVATPAGNSDPVTVVIDSVSPAVFVVSGDGTGAVAVAGTGKLTSERPAAPGDWVEIYATGLGAVQPSSVPGLSETVQKPEVLIGGKKAEVQFSGLAPGWVGLYQVNAKVPSDTPSSLQTLSLAIGGINSNTVFIHVQ